MRNELCLGQKMRLPGRIIRLLHLVVALESFYLLSYFWNAECDQGNEKISVSWQILTDSPLKLAYFTWQKRHTGYRHEDRKY